MVNVKYVSQSNKMLPIMRSQMDSETNNIPSSLLGKRNKINKKLKAKISNK